MNTKDCKKKCQWPLMKIRHEISPKRQSAANLLGDWEFTHSSGSHKIWNLIVGILVSQFIYLQIVVSLFFFPNLVNFFPFACMSFWDNLKSFLLTFIKKKQQSIDFVSDFKPNNKFQIDFRWRFTNKKKLLFFLKKVWLQRTFFSSIFRP